MRTVRWFEGQGKRAALTAKLIASTAAILIGCASAGAQADASGSGAPAPAPAATTAAAPPASASVPTAPASQPAAAAATPTAPTAAPAEAQANGAAQQGPQLPGAPAAAPGQQAQNEQLPDACFAHPAKLQPAEVDQFLAKPEDIFTQYGGGGVALSNRVRSLAGSDRRTLDPLLRLAAAANPDQKAMIGAGLGRAAFACSRTAPAYAAMIQSMIAGVDSPEMLTAFLSATNDIQTAALGAGASGGASGGGGLSGGGLGGPFSAGLGGDEVVPTTAQTYSGTSRSIILYDDDDDDDDDDSVSPANSD